MSKVAVIGGGAAGMMAAAAAAQNGHQVSLYEKNEKLGKKIFITGKGRCNLTNDCEVEELLEAVCVNRKFLYARFMDSQARIRSPFLKSRECAQRQSAATVFFRRRIILLMSYGRFQIK